MQDIISHFQMAKCTDTRLHLRLNGSTLTAAEGIGGVAYNPD